ncbi:MAG: hypothetical protein EOQ63_28550, partial [Mesorhizobium sp.]|uniref:hypothetical protein n=1 Tax=Mesorhizobium sp. TaxID=1871066 RepID=UPI000FE49DDC
MHRLHGLAPGGGAAALLAGRSRTVDRRGWPRVSRRDDKGGTATDLAGTEFLREEPGGFRRLLGGAERQKRK